MIYRVLAALLLAGCAFYEPGYQIDLRVAVTPAPEALDAGWAVVAAVEFQRCPSGSVGLARWLDPVSTAYAHSESNDTRIGVPTVFDLTDAEPQPLGVLTPPRAVYCQVSVTLGPADPDAVGVSLDTLGRTLLLRTGASELGWGGEIQVDFDLPGEGLRVNPTTPKHTVTIHLEPGVWLSDIDPAAEGAADRLADAVRDALRITVE